jgi:hypothetical protein
MSGYEVVQAILINGTQNAAILKIDLAPYKKQVKRERTGQN